MPFIFASLVCLGYYDCLREDKIIIKFILELR